MGDGTQTESAEARSATSRLVSAGALMAAGTMTSRVLGFIRVALLAFLIGNGTRQADIYDIASTIPTSLYILFAGGALNTVLVPQLVRAVKNDDYGGEAYTNRIMTAFGLIVAGIATIATIGTPVIVGRIYASDQWQRPDMAAHLDSMLFLGYLFLPQIFFYGVFFLIGQILNARDHFGPMMWAPVVNNIVQIAVLGIYLGVYGTSDGSQPFTTNQALLLGGGATLGIITQTIVMIICLKRAGFHYRPRFDLRGTGLGHTFSLAKWTLGFVMVNQIALVVVTRLATAATAGGAGAGLAAYNKAYLIFILPHSLVTVSLATAMLPSASRLAADGNMHGVARETMRTMRLVSAILLPAAVAFLALGGPVSDIMFGNGVGAADSGFVGWTLRAFALGLVPFTLQYVCLRAFYALENTRITFLIQVLIAGVQVGLGLALVLPFHAPAWVAPALATAFAGAYLVGFFLSFHCLQRDLPDLRMLELVRQLVRVTAAVLPAGLMAWGGSWLIGYWEASTPVALLVVAVTGVVAVLSYLLMARLLRIGEVNDIIASLLRRGRGGGAAVGSSTPSADADDTGTLTAVPAPDPDTVTVTSDLEPEPDLTEPLRSDELPGSDDDVLPPDEDADEIDEALVDTVVRPAMTFGEFDPAATHPIHAESGQVLVGRYALQELLAERESTQSWVANDQVLSRPVLVHLLPRGHEQNDDLLDAARRSAIATDARFLRVLDAATEPDEPSENEPDGPFVVCEYVAGQNLTSILGNGPLSALEAGWLTREIADALAAMHAQGLYHQRVSPEHVVITPTGNVKIVGFGIQAALDPDHDDGTTDPEQADVRDIGRVLFASLVARWPGGPAHGMAEVPRDAAGDWLTPRQVQAGVSPALDLICQQILTDTPEQGTHLTSMREVVQALTHVLGSADASADLERRMRHPVPVVALGGQPASDDWAEERTQPVPVPSDADATSEYATGGNEERPESTDRLDLDEVDAHASGPRLPAREKEPSRRWLLVLVMLVLIVLVVSLFAVFGRGGEPDPEPAPPPPPQPQPQQITGSSDFDPQGSDGRENPDGVPLSHDGDPATAWETVVYRHQDMAPKDGVGVTFDLAAAAEVTAVELTLVGDGTTLDVRVPDGDQWRTVGTAEQAGSTVTVELTEPVRTDTVQVWLRILPENPDGGYLGGIAEVSVLGHS